MSLGESTGELEDWERVSLFFFLSTHNGNFLQVFLPWISSRLAFQSLSTEHDALQDLSLGNLFSERKKKRREEKEGGERERESWVELECEQIGKRRYLQKYLSKRNSLDKGWRWILQGACRNNEKTRLPGAEVCAGKWKEINRCNRSLILNKLREKDGSVLVRDLQRNRTNRMCSYMKRYKELAHVIWKLRIPKSAG